MSMHTHRRTHNVRTVQVLHARRQRARRGKWWGVAVWQWQRQRALTSSFAQSMAGASRTPQRRKRWPCSACPRSSTRDSEWARTPSLFRRS